MITNRNLTLDNLISINSSGVDVASFVELKSALITRYKQIYGDDIDVSTGNADGEFLNEMALIINNILQSIKTMYSNLDVNTASGTYLDALCNLSNVHRKGAVNSKASVIITNISDSSFYNFPQNLTFQDQAGNIWNGESSFSPIELDPGKSTGLNVICSVAGPVAAPIGWINLLVGSPDILVEQEKEAIVGSEAETDEDLRSRRNQYISPMGTTVMRSLAAALLDTSGIKDIKIYNNNTNFPKPAKDTTSISSHSVYIIVRQYSNEINIDAVIGDIIYNKLTPGIPSIEAAVGNAKSATHIPTMLDQSFEEFEDTVYWKQAVGIAPSIVLKYSVFQNAGYTNDTKKIVYDAIKDYLNNIHIGNNPDKNDILMEAMFADPRTKGIPTIFVNYDDIDISNVADNPDTFYDYEDYAESNVVLSQDKYNIFLGTKGIEVNNLSSGTLQIKLGGTTVFTCPANSSKIFNFDTDSTYTIEYSSLSGMQFIFDGEYDGTNFVSQVLTASGNNIATPNDTSSNNWTFTENCVLNCIHN